MKTNTPEMKVINAYGKEYEDEILDALKDWQSLIPPEEMKGGS